MSRRKFTSTSTVSGIASPLFGFGHGLSYTAFEYGDLVLGADRVDTDGEVTIACTVRNTGEVAGSEVVQLYLHDIHAQVTRPLRQLADYARVPLEPGRTARVTFRLHADRTAFTGIDLRRIVEPGDVDVYIGASVNDLSLQARFRLTGPTRVVGHDRVLTTPTEIAVLD